MLYMREGWQGKSIWMAGGTKQDAPLLSPHHKLCVLFVAKFNYWYPSFHNNFFLLSPKLHTHGLPHRIFHHHFRTSIDEIINIAAAAGVTTEDDEDEEADDDESSEEGSADRLLVF